MKAITRRMNIGDTLFASDRMVAVFTLIPIIFYLVLIVFAIYFAIKVMKFMNEKIRLDREFNEKLTEIMKALNQHQKDS